MRRVWLYLVLFICFPPVVAAQKPLSFSIGIDRVNVEFNVSDRQKSITGLKREDFILLDEGVPQQVLHFDSAEQPLDLMLLLDVSASMSNMLDSLKLRALEALKELRPQDRVGIMSFSGEYHLVLPPTHSHTAVASETQYLYVRGLGTELYSNILATARYLQSVARPGARKAILIITDNDGNRRGVSSAQLLYSLWEMDVTLNGIFYPRGHWSFLADCRPAIEGTGGELLWADTKHLPLADMFAKLRDRYVITYAPPEATPGSKRRIQLRIRYAERDPERRRWRVRTRSGYTVPNVSVRN